VNIKAGKQKNPTIETLLKIAKALEVPIEKLLE
jgi:transcriptional regulator with XRE-family HTH domain